MVFIVSLITRLISYISFEKPMLEIGQAARKVAAGDFNVRVHSQRKDDKKDELELLIDDFNKMVKELATIETLKSDFISNISHEIKTPLAIIQSYASALQKDELPKAEKKKYIETILEASQKLSSLVSNILRLNKLESQEIIQTEAYSLDEQLRCCILALEEKFEQKSIEFDADLEEITITSDESLMEIVWNNLLTNAIKFTESNGSVKVTLKKYNNKAIVSVSDTGCGMSEETCKKIFERFYQGDTSHSTEGNGLGLALVKRVIDLVEGEINVMSGEGKGTTFTVALKM
jgi:signal transduction histidine kinase